MPQLVRTIPERCRVCYKCVRECPSKAIRIVEGQAEVVVERCVGCGNCVRVCSQRAKRVFDSIPAVRALLARPEPVVAVVAPSFPVEFTDADWRQVIGMVRALGFAGVHEVGFGADLVATRYRELLDEEDDMRWIATTCPAVVGYVERYYPELVGRLARLVSPMIAMVRALRRTYGPDARYVFIGPCVAKKLEALDESVSGEVDVVLTFVELRKMLDDDGIKPDAVEPSDFDGPVAGPGALFPISRGLLQAADIKEDLIVGHVVAADGRMDFLEALKESSTGDLRVRLLEVLACKGCVSGPGVCHDEPLFSRRRRVREFVQHRMANFDRAQWNEDLSSFDDLDLSRSYSERKVPRSSPFEGEIRRVLRRLGKKKPEDELNCGACGYDTCREHAVAILEGLAEEEMCLPYTIEQLHSAVDELGESNRRLASTKEALMHSEKLASMGQLAAGIAHEVNNPLGVVLMYSHLLRDELSSNAGVKEDLDTIAREADRCKKIVSGLLDFARQTKVLREPVDLVELAEKTCRALPAPKGVNLVIESGTEDPVAEVDADQIAQVLTNLITNAYGAISDDGGVTIRVEGDEENVQFSVIDTGVGIPPENMDKIFEPFFTTKQMGKGTGLGLAVVYGIVKMHGGDIKVESNADSAAGQTGTVFTVELPRQVGESSAVIG